MAAARAQVFLIHLQRRRAHAIAGEHGRGTRRLISHNQCEIGAAALFQSSFGRTKLEALGQKNSRNVAHAEFGDLGNGSSVAGVIELPHLI